VLKNLKGTWPFSAPSKKTAVPCGRNPSVLFSCVRAGFLAVGFHKAGNDAGLTEKENDMTTNKKPAYEIFTVREGTKGRKSRFTKIGAAWTAKSGNGLTLFLDALPLDGKLILMPPKAKEEAATETPATDDGAYIDDAGHFAQAH
jgi:hypothetical protein